MKVSDIVVSISSKNRDVSKYPSPSYFRAPLPSNINLKNVIGVKLIGGYVPNTFNQRENRYLYLSVEEFKNNHLKITDLNQPIFAKLVYDFRLSTNDWISFLLYQDAVETYIGDIRALTISIFDQDGDLMNFGNDVLSVASFSNTNPTTITTLTDHGLTTGEKIYIKGFDNGSTQSVNDFINRPSGHIVTVLNSTQFTINVNLSGESSNQTTTGVEIAYPLGKYAIALKGFHTYENALMKMLPRPYTFSTTNPTVITCSSNHGLTTGDHINIKDFDNGTTNFINSLVNQMHQVTVISSTSFSIPVDLSTQNANQQKTYTKPPYLLGSTASIIKAKLQTSFDFQFITQQPDKPKFFYK